MRCGQGLCQLKILPPCATKLLEQLKGSSKLTMKSKGIRKMRDGFFKTILIDPPWPERGGGRIKRGADKHYKLLSVKDISALAISILSKKKYRPSDNSHLWLWTTNNYLPQALQLMKKLGYRYINNVCWGKVKNGKIQKGLGQYFFGSHELCLFGVRGKLKAVKRSPTLLLSPRGKHSRKPEGMYEKIETISPGPRLELFARARRQGWDSWGDELQRA